MTKANLSSPVRLTEDVALPKGIRQISTLRDGPSRIIVRANTPWDDFFASPGIDLSPREQPDLIICRAANPGEAGGHPP